MEDSLGFTVNRNSGGDQPLGFTVNESSQPRGNPKGNAAKDALAFWGVGSNNLLKIVGQGYGLVSGNMDNAAIRVADENIALYESLKSQEQLDSDTRYQLDVKEADGTLNEAYRSFVGTVSDPRQAAQFITEQLPMLMATAGGGAVAGVAAKTAGAGAGAVGTASVGGAIGTGAAMQGSSVGGETYEQLLEQNPGLWGVHAQMQELMNEGMSEQDAKAEVALDLSRRTGLAAGSISVLVNKFVPGAAILERALVGQGSRTAGNLASRIVGGALGEGVSEAIEEGSGAALSNLGVAQVNPEQDLLEGVGQAAGQGAASFIFGGVAGATSGRAPRTGNQELDGADTELDEFLGNDPEVGQNGLDATDLAGSGTEELSLAPAGEPMGFTVNRRSRPGTIGPDQLAGLDPAGLAIGGNPLSGDPEIETPAQIEARLYPPREGDIDYVAPGAGDTGGLELAAPGTGPGSGRIFDQPGDQLDSLSLAPIDQTPVRRSKPSNTDPGLDVLGLESDEQAQSRLAGSPQSPTPEGVRTPDVLSAQKFERVSQKYAALANDQEDPQIKAQLERFAEIAASKARGEQPKTTAAERAALARVVDPGRDTIDVALRRLGGLDVETETDLAGRLSHLDANDKTVGLPPIERKNGQGLTLDAATELLLGDGYVNSYDQSELLDKLERAAAGEKIYSNAVDLDALAERDFEQERDDAEFQESVRRANIPNLPEMVTELRSAGLDGAEIDKLIGDLRSYDLSPEEVAAGFEEILNDLREQGSQTGLAGSSNEEGRSDERSQQELRPGLDVEQSTEIGNGRQRSDDGQQSPTSEPVREGSNQVDGVGQIDAFDGASEQSSGSARDPAQQQRSESQESEREVDAIDGSSIGQERGTGNAEEQPGGNSEEEVSQDDAGRKQPVQAGSERQESRRKKVLLNLIGNRFAKKSPAIRNLVAKAADEDPSPDQAAAGNYEKGHMRAFGFDISIETAKGSDRVGYDDEGKEIWRNRIGAHYGHFLGTKGADGDQIDVFIGDAENIEDLPVYIMNAKKPSGRGFDEHKVFAGFKTIVQARKAFDSSYPKNWKGGSRLVQVTGDQLKTWLQEGDTSKAFKKIDLTRSSAPKKPSTPPVKPTTPTTPTTPEPASGKIDDFGEKIGGARKDQYGSLTKGYLGDIADGDVTAAKALPKLNYRALLDAGMSRNSLAAIAYMRAEIGPKPRKSYRLKSWVAEARSVRAQIQKIIDGVDFDPRSLVAHHEASANQFDFLAAVEPEYLDAATKYRFHGSQKWSKAKSAKDGPIYYSLNSENKRSGMVYLRSVTDDNTDREAAIAEAAGAVKRIADGKKPKKSADGTTTRKPIPLSVYRVGRTGKYAIGFKRAKNFIAVETFDTAKEAHTRLREGKDELNALVESRRQPPQLRGLTNADRIGPKRRAGNATTDSYQQFGFYGVEFGNWVENDARQANLNEAHDALLDMAEALSLPPRALSLDGSLGLAFGARGKGGKMPAKAHFEPTAIAINLTKRTGAGSLAHEWLHGLDNYFARVNADKINGRDPVLGFLSNIKPAQIDKIDPELFKAWKAIVDFFPGSKVIEVSKEIDAYFMGKPYFATDIELMARAFEAYITKKLADTGISNDYLANIDKTGGLYPSGAELDTVSELFDAMFKLVADTPSEAKQLLNSGDEGIRGGNSVESYEVPTQFEAHEDPGGWAASMVNRLRRVGGSVLASRISRDFEDKGNTSLLGQNIRSPEDLARLGQIYRNPSFETMRLMITDAKGNVIMQTGLTSRLPGEVSWSNDQQDEMMNLIGRALDEDGQAKAWFFHNHPSGNPQPSTQDMSYTRKIGETLRDAGFPDALAGHVIVNNQSYGLVNSYGLDETFELKGVGGYRSDENPMKPSPVLGMRVTAPEELARVVKAMERSTNPSLVHVDSQGTVSGIVEFPFSALDMKKGKLLALLRDSVRLTGASRSFIVNAPVFDPASERFEGLTPNQSELIMEAWRAGRFTSIMTVDGIDLHSVTTGGQTSKDDLGRSNGKAFSVKEDPPEYNSDARDQSLLERAKKQPVDTVFFATAEGIRAVLNKTGTTEAAQRSTKATAQAMSDFYTDRMGFLAPAVEGFNNLFIDRYGLSQDYIRTDQSRINKQRVLSLRAMELVKKMQQAGINDLGSAKALQQILTSEAPPTEALQGMAQEIRDEITELGKRAVSLGMVSKESFERNKAIYLHRVYQQYEVTDQGAYGIGAKFLQNRRKKVLGDAFKGRGLFQKVKIDRIKKDIPRELLESRKLDKGAKVRIVDMVTTDHVLVEEGKPKVLQRLYLLPDQSIPVMDGAQAMERGTFEVRQASKDNLVLWRDYTPKERQSMGEITDSRYTLIRTMQVLANDLATGEYYRDISRNADWTWNGEGEPPNSTDGTMGNFRSLRPLVGITWVKMPSTIVPKSGGKKVYGDLSGKYVKAEIYRDIMSVEAMQNQQWFDRVMRFWKINKTARNPVTHMNNVMSNVLLADMVDVRADHVYEALRSWRHKDAHYQEANAYGAFGGSFIESEIKRDILDPILKEIDASMAEANSESDRSNSMLLIRTMHSLKRGLNKAVGAVGKIDNAMLATYQLEDELFRLATYKKFREEGIAPEEAAIRARDQFLNYDIRAPGINALRRTVLPFISYTYRAVPVIASAIATRPHKLAKYVTMAYLFNAIGYALSKGDEEEERRSLRKEESGFTWVGAPRFMRMPWDDFNDNPVFLDIRRWIPAGDVFDVTQGQASMPIPAPLNPGGPLILAAEFLANKNFFNGRQIVNKRADDAYTKTIKNLDHFWKGMAPSNLAIPFSWYQEKLWDAAHGARDRSGRPYSVTQALLNSIGIKIKPVDVDYNMQLKAEEVNRIMTQIKMEMGFLGRDFARGGMSQATYNRKMKRYMQRIQSVRESAIEDFGG